MLERVLNMFDPNDEFLLVTTPQLYQDNVQLFEKIQASYTFAQVTLIKAHEKGPVESITNESVVSWIGRDDFIVSYCDFFLKWSYSDFKKHLSTVQPDGSIITFKGLQPASLGTTFFAYIKANESVVIDIKEKESFTENRIEELASAGIYYFRSMRLFLDSVERAKAHFDQFKEKYVSLVYKGLLDSNKKVTHFEAEKFICLGTPIDYEEFLYWECFFEKVKKRIENGTVVSNKIIPMAGFGERFRRAGINVPKPLIPVRSKPMFLHALDSEPRAKNTFLVIMRNYKDRFANAISSHDSKANLLLLEERTSGMGQTVLHALQQASLDSDILIMSCDYEQFFQGERFLEYMSDVSIDGVIFYTRFNPMRMQSPSAFGYCETDASENVIRIVEKQILSETPWNDKLLIGTFWIRQTNVLEHALLSAEAQGYLVNGELYIANSLNVIINNGGKLKAMEVDFWISYGDPQELAIYDWWEDVFLSGLLS